MLAWYRSLIRLRQSTPDLRSADLKAVEVQFNESEGWLLMQRGQVTVACNFGSKAWLAPTARRAEVVLASDDNIKAGNEGVVLGPESVAILDASQESKGHNNGVNPLSKGAAGR